MDRIINVKVGGNYLSKDSKNAGVKGEGNVTKLRITFDEGWNDYAKTVTFFDAHGNNPVKMIQGVDLIEDITEDALTYITPIPPEPLAIAGELTFVIDGYFDGKRQRSIADKLVVKDSPDTDNAGEPTDPTPTQAEQLQKEIDSIKNTIQEATIAEQNAKASENKAKYYEEKAGEYHADVMVAKYEAEESATLADSYAQAANIHKTHAKECLNLAREAISHNPILVNGYWHVWDAENEKYVNTEVRGQSGSVVHIGDNPPPEAEVIIDPEGESSIYAPYIGDNENWYTFNPETQTFTDSGHKAVPKDGTNGKDGISCTHSWNGATLTVTSASGQSSSNLKGDKGDRGTKGDKGDKGEKGDAYILTEADKTEIGDSVSAEIEAELSEALDEIIYIETELMTPIGDGVKY
jgi:hypothetical protein